MTIVDTTTVAVLFALIGLAVAIGFTAIGVALVRVYSASRPVRTVRPTYVASQHSYAH